MGASVFLSTQFFFHSVSGGRSPTRVRGRGGWGRLCGPDTAVIVVACRPVRAGGGGRGISQTCPVGGGGLAHDRSYRGGRDRSRGRRRGSLGTLRGGRA